jgi:hypothetical protein
LVSSGQVCQESALGHLGTSSWKLGILGLLKSKKERLITKKQYLINIAIIFKGL